MAHKCVRATQPIPEVIDLIGLLTDEGGGGPRASLFQPVAKHFLFGDKGIALMRRELCLRTLEWKLEEMSRKVARPGKTKSVDVLLYSIFGTCTVMVMDSPGPPS